MSVPSKKGNNMNTFNLSKMRIKKLAWMLEDWPNWLYLVDAFRHLLPKHAVASGDCNVQKQNLMGGKFKEDQEPQGPPNE